MEERLRSHLSHPPLDQPRVEMAVCKFSVTFRFVEFCTHCPPSIGCSMLLRHQRAKRKRLDTPRHGDKEIKFLPKVLRHVNMLSTILNADPRWPLTEPKYCLCGVPKHAHEEMQVPSVFRCSRCHARVFCSKECMAKSWKNPRVSTSATHQALENYASHVGKAPRHQMQEAMACEGTNYTAEMEQFYQDIGTDGIYVAPSSLDDVYANLEEYFKKNRKNKKNNNRRGTGKKK